MQNRILKENVVMAQREEYENIMNLMIMSS